MKGNYQSAIGEFTEALKINAEYAEAYENRGRAYAKTGRDILASQDFQKACALGLTSACQEKTEGE